MVWILLPYWFTLEMKRKIQLFNLNTGDYHDNMNGKMFNNRITTKVIPLAACNYPGVRMVLVMENAPRHHIRVIPYIVRFSKKSTDNLMKEHGINYVLLPLNNKQISILPYQ